MQVDLVKEADPSFHALAADSVMEACLSFLEHS